MAAKATGNGEAKDSFALVVEQAPEERQEQAVARMALTPSLQSALTLKDYTKTFGELDLMSLIGELRSQIDQAVEGNLERAEAMLATQAHTLDAIFGNLARRAIHAEFLPQFDAYLKLALRAQSQCRATWETLSAIKNPVGRAYVGQANFAHNQQVNNATDASGAREKRNTPNELLEKTDGERLDGCKAAEAVRADTDLEAVGEINRSKVARRKG